MTAITDPEALTLRAAIREDCGLILEFITELAEYENLQDLVSATTDLLADSLFGENPSAEVIIAEWDGHPAGFALYFTNYSTFLARPGIYLEDLFVRPEWRGRGIGKALLVHLARLVLQRGGARLDWSVLDWNHPAIDFYDRVDAKVMKDWLPMRLEGEALRKLVAGT